MFKPLYIQTLGRFRVLRGDAPVADKGWGTHRAKTLLKVLLTHYGQPLTRDQIVEAIWPDVSPEAATRALYTAVSDLRRVLEPTLAKPADSTFILSTDEGYCYSSEAIDLIDKRIFAQTIETARGYASQHSLVAAAQAYSQAETLYAGDFLPDDAYADWGMAERERLRVLFLTTLLESAEVQGQLGHYREAIAKCRRALELDNCFEAGYRALMRYYHSSGERPQALRAYTECQIILQRELGVEPMPETTALFHSIKETVSSSAETRITNLPIALTSFVGRKRELARVKKSLARTRLLTITGAGGSGKTRLALRAADDLIDSFKDGVWWVELAAMNDQALVTRAVAKVLGVFEQPQRPLIETLQDHLHSRQLLLVLDNCEHLIYACAQLANDLLGSAPRLKILATSREALGLTGEMIWQVPPLSLPDASFSPPGDRLMQYEAIHLFVERAVAVNQHFSLTRLNGTAVAQVCQRLDGLPLAIELAAARAQTLSPQQIAARLDDRFSLLTGGSRAALARHQTLRAAIDWSYNLLSESERVLLCRLSVFAGGWTLEGAAAVCATRGLDGNAILDLLTHLAAKSLVDVEHQAAQPRYRLLETIRQYARQHLDDSGETQRARARHSDWCIEFAEQANAKFWGREQDSWARQLEAEHDNLRAALAWCLEHDIQSGLRIANALWQFWILRGYLVEGQERLQNMLAKAPGHTLLRAQALLSLAAITVRLGDNVSSAALIRECLSIYQELDDKLGSSQAYQFLGAVVVLAGEYGRARAAIETSLALAQAAEIKMSTAAATHFLGCVSEAEGDFSQAKEWMEKSLSLFRQLHDRPDVCNLFLNAGWTGIGEGRLRGIVDEETIILWRQVGTRSASGFTLANLGMLARAEGDYGRAKGLLEEALAEFRAMGDQAGCGQVLGQLGNLARVAGDYAPAKLFLEASLELRRELGDRRGIGRTLCSLGNLAAAEGHYAQAREFLNQGLELFEEMRDKPGLAAVFSHLGNVAMGEGDFTQAGLLYSKCYEVFQELGVSQRLAVTLLNLADCARLGGDHPLARTRLEESLAIFQRIGYRPGVAVISEELSNLARDQADDT